MNDLLLTRLLGPDGPEVSCEACFELLDEYVDGAREIPGMAAHLDGCPACREDHESLRALVAAEG